MNNPLTAIPPKVRQWLYLGYAVAGLLLGAVQVYGADTIFGLELVKLLGVLAYVGVALGFTAASNLPSYDDVVDGDLPPPQHRADTGQADLNTVLLFVALVVLVAVVVLILTPPLGLR